MDLKQCNPIIHFRLHNVTLFQFPYMMYLKTGRSGDLLPKSPDSGGFGFSEKDGTRNTVPKRFPVQDAIVE